jgi:hypothetical protein
MKAWLFFLLILLTASCRSAWNQDDAVTFRKACLSDAATWARSPDQASAYCDCVIAKVKAKYPDEDEAMNHIDSLAYDTDLQACKDALLRH